MPNPKFWIEYHAEREPKPWAVCWLDLGRRKAVLFDSMIVACVRLKESLSSSKKPEKHKKRKPRVNWTSDRSNFNLKPEHFADENGDIIE